MRETKFRGKRKDNGEWVYGSLLYLWPDGPVYIVGIKGMAGLNTWCIDLPCELEANVIEIIPETVGQFTGLHDKNGKALDWWQGDVFEHRISDYPLEIVYENAAFWLKTIGSNVRYPLGNVVSWQPAPMKIGNVHDNKELLNI